MFDYLLKPRTQLEELRDEFGSAFGRVMRSGVFLGGEEVSGFEKEFSELIGVEYCIGCARYHDALELLLRINGIGEDEEVIVPALGPIHVPQAVEWTGARPRFVDVRPGDFTIDPEQVDAAITDATRAIIAVHLFGHPAAMEQLAEIADAHGLFLIEDASQAHGASLHGVPVGGFSHAAAFRFAPGSVLGAYGEAAAIVTRDEGIARRIFMLVNNGEFGGDGQHYIRGTDSRLSEIQAALLRVKMHRLPTYLKKRRGLADLYRQGLAGLPFSFPELAAEAVASPVSFPVLAEDTSAALEFLGRRGWSFGMSFPDALPFLRCYRFLHTAEDDFPVTSEVRRKLLPLPLTAEMVRLDVEEICEGLKREIGAAAG